MSRDILLRRLGADTFLSRHSAQPFERALVIEWSCSGDGSFVLRFVTRNGEILLPPCGSISLL
jgi:hypothetical protein